MTTPGIGQVISGWIWWVVLAAMWKHSVPAKQTLKFISTFKSQFLKVKESPSNFSGLSDNCHIFSHQSVVKIIVLSTLKQIKKNGTKEFFNTFNLFFNFLPSPKTSWSSRSLV